MDVIYEAASLIDAHLVRIALEQQAGIPAFVRGEALLGGWRIAGLRTVGRLRSTQLRAGGADAGQAMAAGRRCRPGVRRATLATQRPSPVTLHARFVR